MIFRRKENINVKCVYIDMKLGGFEVCVNIRVVFVKEFESCVFFRVLGWLRTRFFFCFRCRFWGK